MKRYSPPARRTSPATRLPWRPLVSPPSVEDHDACAIYASVRKDATPSREPVDAGAREPPEDAPPRRQRRRRGRRLRRPGRHPAPDLGRGGPRRRPQPGARATTRPSPSRTSSSSAPPTSSRSATTPASCSGAAGFRILAERLGAVDSQALGRDRARGGAALLAGRRPARRRRDRRPRPVRADGRARVASSASTCRRSRRRTCVYKVMGAPKVLGELLPRPRRRALRDRRLLRPQPLLDQHLAVVHAACSRSRSSATTARSTRSSSCARRRGCSASAIPAGRLGLPGPEPHDRAPGPRRGPLARRGDGDGRAAGRQRDPLAAGRAAPVLHVPARGDGPVRAGPGGADRPPRRRVRVLRRRARACARCGSSRPPDDYVFSSEPGVVWSTRWSPSRSRWARARS